jgi:hypothetical protein
MRRALVLALTLAAAPIGAQVPELPALQEGATNAPAQPLRDGKVDRVEALHRGGQLLMLVVTPPGGRSYFLLDGQSWSRRDPLDPGLHVPLWPVVSLD